MPTTEVELKFLDFDKEVMEEKLRELGAEKKYESNVKSVYFVDEAGEFSFNDSSTKCLRIRKVDGKNLLTFKGESEKSEVKKKEEIEVEVDDFDETVMLMKTLGLKATKPYYKRRTHYEFGNVHFEVEEIEGVPPYLEIETHSEEGMEKICEKLALDVSEGDKRIAPEIWPEVFKP